MWREGEHLNDQSMQLSTGLRGLEVDANRSYAYIALEFWFRTLAETSSTNINFFSYSRSIPLST